MIWGTDKSSKIVQLKDINEYMESNNYPTFEKVKRQCQIQNGSKLTPYTPWNAKNIVFVPEGKLGLIKNAYANNELKPESDVAYWKSHATLPPLAKQDCPLWLQYD